ncbi:hypothetical protein [Streptomyces bauhiniae]|uniref:hypothetical protein n=1 Tax=Streptomyces bauhiniae TaxID=2340725 RepID=UPI0035D90383
MLVLLLAIVFAAVEVLPGDAAGAAAERGESAADLAGRRHVLGLDRPLWERFAGWMMSLLTGDLGTSARGQKVTELLADPLPNTLVLTGAAFAVTAFSLYCSAAGEQLVPVVRPTGSSAMPRQPRSPYPSSWSRPYCCSYCPCGRDGSPRSP